MDDVTSPLHILLVEDNRGDVVLIREAMRAHKIANEMSVVGDGESAVAFVRREPPYEDAARPDLILLDLNLPVMSGQEVLAAVKSDPATRMIPVVVMTSSEAESDIARSYSLNANCYVTKPLDLDRFAHVVQSVETFWLSIVRLPSTAVPGV